MINHGALSLVSQYSDYTHFYWYVGRRRRKEGECEGLGSCLTVSTLLMDPTNLDCQKLTHCLGKEFLLTIAQEVYMETGKKAIRFPLVGDEVFVLKASRVRASKIAASL